jgi:hypothetical protein
MNCAPHLPASCISIFQILEFKCAPHPSDSARVDKPHCKMNQHNAAPPDNLQRIHRFHTCARVREMHAVWGVPPSAYVLDLGGAGATSETETSRFVREAFFHRPLSSTMHSCSERAGKAGPRGEGGQGMLVAIS